MIVKRRLFAGLAVSVALIAVVASQTLGRDVIDPKSGTVILNRVNDDVSPAAVAEMKLMPPGSTVVECAPGVPKLPAGVTPSRSMVFVMTHPGFAVLADGHCVYDTSAPVADLNAANLDTP